MNIWFPESIYFGALAYSVLMVTTALFFYHMTRVRSLEIPPLASGIFAISFILISIFFVAIGIASYYTRLHEIQPEDITNEQRIWLRHEKIYWILYLSLGILYILIQIGISSFIITGTLRALNSRK